MNIHAKIAAIEKEIRETPYHKATERHIGNLRARLAKLRHRAGQQKGKQSKGKGYAVRKKGDATVILIGPPSVGKSTLINALTNVRSPVAAYEFTTLKVIAGMMLYKGGHIQILDLPGLVTGAAEGKGGGKQVLSLVRIADLLILITDWARATLFGAMEHELDAIGINRKKLAVLRVINKVDLASPQQTILSKKGVVMISAKRGDNLTQLKEQIWEQLKLMRIYLWQERQIRLDDKAGKSAARPLVLPAGSTVREAAEKLSGPLAREITGAKIWGAAAVFAGQPVSLDYRLTDKLTVRFLKKRQRRRNQACS